MGTADTHTHTAKVKVWRKTTSDSPNLRLSKWISLSGIHTHICAHVNTRVAQWKKGWTLRGQCVTHYHLGQKYLADFSSPLEIHQVENWLARSLLFCYECGTYFESHCRISFLLFYPVIRAKIREVKTKCHDVTAVVEVKEILKSSLVNIPRDTVNLYTSSGCLCPPLNVNEEYIIMGYEDEERSR